MIVAEEAKMDAYLASLGKRPLQVVRHDPRSEIHAADVELARFVRYQVSEFRSLGYPSVTAFAKMISNGGHSLSATPEDPTLDAVAKFFWSQNDVKRRIMIDKYSAGTEYQRAKRASMSVHRLRAAIESLLVALAKHLRGE